MSRVPPVAESEPSHSLSTSAPRLIELRKQVGMSQLELAERAQITRQSLYAIEQGKALPSVAVAIRLARSLGTTVEQLFEEETKTLNAVAAMESVVPGTRVVLGWRKGERVAWPLDPKSSIDTHRPADGVVTKRRRQQVEVEVISEAEMPRDVLVVAGCAPALSVIAQRLTVGRTRIVFQQAASLNALELLRGDYVQVAGIHLDSTLFDGNAALVQKYFRQRHLILVNLATWEQGFVVAAGNPKRIRSASDLLRRGVRVIQREPAAAAQMLLERLIVGAGEEVAHLTSVAVLADSHLDLARFVGLGLADVGVATRAAADAYGLDFVPLTEERFDLVIPTEIAQQSLAGRFIDALREPGTRREINSLGGYGTAHTGELVAEL